MASPVALYGATSGLGFISFLAASAFAPSVFKRTAPSQSRPLRLSRLFLKLAVPTLVLGLLLFSIVCAIAAASYTTFTANLGTANLYISIIAAFFIITADIFLTLSLYTSAIATLYATIHNEKWWTFLRLDAPVGGLLLMILNIVIFARQIQYVATGEFDYADRVIQRWFPFIINGTLLLVTVGVLGTVVYSSVKMKKRGGALVAAFGKIPTFLYVATVLWLARCSFAWSLDIKTIARDFGSRGETEAIIVLTPLFEGWIDAALVYLLARIIRNPVWSDASVHPNPVHPAVGGYNNGAPQQDGYPKY